MKNKIVDLFVVMLLMATLVQLSGCIKRNEELDQISGEDNAFFDFLIMVGYDAAQSFVPTLKTLSHVEVKIQTEGDPGYLNVSIRKNLYDVDLASSSMHSDQLADGINWLNFDIEDIKLTPGETYYIVCSSTGGVFQNTYKWRGTENNPYPDGDGWMYNIFSGSWDERNDTDFCFKTYGYKGLQLVEHGDQSFIEHLRKYPHLIDFLERHSTGLPLMQELLDASVIH